MTVCVYTHLWQEDVQPTLLRELRPELRLEPFQEAGAAGQPPGEQHVLGDQGLHRGVDGTHSERDSLREARLVQADVAGVEQHLGDHETLVVERQHLALHTHRSCMHGQGGEQTYMHAE